MISPDVADDSFFTVNEASDGGFDQAGVARVVLAELVVEDGSFAGFTKIELVTELDLGTGFATFEDVDRAVIKTENLVFIADAVFAADAFVSLFESGGKLI